MGEIPRAYSQAFALSDNMDAESESDEETEDIRQGLAAIRLLKEMKQCIRAPWAKAIMVKVYGNIMIFMLSLWGFGNQPEESIW